MTLSNIFMLFFYWLFLSGVVFTTGAFTLRIFVTGPSGADVCRLNGKKECFGESATRFILTISLITFFVNAVHLVLHVSVMTETPLNEVQSIIFPFLTKTKYGKFTILRSVFLSVIILISFLALKRENTWLTVSGIVSSFMLLIVISMSGHQGAKGYVNVPFVLDVFHIISVSLWIGGIFFLRFCFSFFLKDAGQELWDSCRSLMSRFSQLATYCVFIAGASGIVLAYFNVKSLSQVFQSQYGLVLLIKTFLVGIIFIIGGVNKYFLIPPLNTTDRGNWSRIVELRRKLYGLITAEAYIGFVVLLLTSLLTHLSPEG